MNKLKKQKRQNIKRERKVYFISIVLDLVYLFGNGIEPVNRLYKYLKLLDKNLKINQDHT